MGWPGKGRRSGRNRTIDKVLRPRIAEHSREEISLRHDLHGRRVPVDLPLLPVALIAEQCRRRGPVAEDRVLINRASFADRP